MSYNPIGKAAAALKFDASSGTPTINRAFNATITDDGVGLFTINFAVAFGSVEYVMAGNGRCADTTGTVWAEVLYRRDTTAAKTASTCKIKTVRELTGNNLHTDIPEITIAFYGYQ